MSESDQKCSKQSAMADISRAMEGLRLAVGGAVQSAGNVLSSSFPPTDILDEGNRYIISVDLPGMTKENISLECSETALIIKASRVEDTLIDTAGYIRRERGASEVYRRIELQEDADRDRLDAELINGVLRIEVPKKESYLKKVEVR